MSNLDNKILGLLPRGQQIIWYDVLGDRRTTPISTFTIFFVNLGSMIAALSALVVPIVFPMDNFLAICTEISLLLCLVISLIKSAQVQLRKFTMIQGFTNEAVFFILNLKKRKLEILQFKDIHDIQLVEYDNSDLSTIYFIPRGDFDFRGYDFQKEQLIPIEVYNDA